jgi:hypothetical protein
MSQEIMRMKPHVLIAAALALAAFSPAAWALTLSNADDAPYSITVTMRDGISKTVDVAAKGSADVDCPEGCELTLNEEKKSVDAAISRLKVEGGKFIE